MTDVGITPEDAFAQLGNEIRVDIIRILGTDAPLSFSELHDRTDVRDSGQFNYHVNQLLGSFVRQTEGGAYELTYAGNRVIGAIFSGEFSPGGLAEEFALASDCIDCQTPLMATYEDETVGIRCPDCEGVDSHFGFPPGGFEGRSPSDLTTVFDRWLRSVFALIGDGICNNCAGTLTPGMTDDSRFIHPDDPVCIEYACERCGDEATLSVSSYLSLRPEVVGFYYKHDVDLRAIDMWNARSFVDPAIAVASEDPWEIKATFEAGGDHLSVILDENLTITPA